MIYFLRHGESTANVQHVFAGQKDDSPLTPKGHIQAQEAAQLLADKNIDRIVTTSLARARDTAHIISEHIDCDDVAVDDRLLEYDMGVLTGTPNRTIVSELLVSADGAEDPEDFRRRVMDALKDIRSSGLDTLIISHAGVGRIIESERIGANPRNFYDIKPYPNAQLIPLDLDWLQ